MSESGKFKFYLKVFSFGIVVASIVYGRPVSADSRDPTRPLSYTESSEIKGQITISRGSLIVESILISSRRRIVVINGRSLGEGDYFDGMQITVIGEDSVGIRSEGEVFFLKPESAATLLKRQS